MSFEIKLALFAVIALSDVFVTALVGIRLFNRGRLPAAAALGIGTMSTLAVIGYLLFVYLD